MFIASLLLIATQAAPGAVQVRAADPAKVAKTCRSEGKTGSRLSGKRRCLTAAEWAKDDEAKRRDYNAEFNLARRIPNN